MADVSTWLRRIHTSSTDERATANIAYGLFALSQSIAEVAAAIKSKPDSSNGVVR